MLRLKIIGSHGYQSPYVFFIDYKSKFNAINAITVQ